MVRGRRVVVGAVVLAVVAAVAWTVWPSGPAFGERFTRPTAAYPAPLGTGTPAGPLRVAASSTGRLTVSGGLAVLSGGPATVAGRTVDGGAGRLTAVGLRDGSVYWTERRDGHAVETSVADADTDTLAVLWDDGLLERIDARGGRVLWHRELGHAVAAPWPRLWWDPQAGRVVLLSAHRIDVVGVNAGVPGWSAVLPDGDSLTAGWPAIGARTLTVWDLLSGGSSQFLGYDLRSGNRLWQRDGAGYQWPLPDGPDRLVLAGAGRPSVVVDAGSGRDLTQLDAKGMDVESTSGGAGYGFSAGTDARATTLGAVDLTTGAVRWTTALPAGQTVTRVSALGGTLYATVIDTGQVPHRLLLLSYDAATGTRQDSTVLPTVLPSGAADPTAGTYVAASSVAAGTVTVSETGYADSSAATLVLAAAP